MLQNRDTDAGDPPLSTLAAIHAFKTTTDNRNGALVLQTLKNNALSNDLVISGSGVEVNSLLSAKGNISTNFMKIGNPTGSAYLPNFQLVVEDSIVAQGKIYSEDMIEGPILKSQDIFLYSGIDILRLDRSNGLRYLNSSGGLVCSYTPSGINCTTGLDIDTAGILTINSLSISCPNASITAPRSVFTNQEATYTQTQYLAGQIFDIGVSKTVVRDGVYLVSANIPFGHSLIVTFHLYGDNDDLGGSFSLRRILRNGLAEWRWQLLTDNSNIFQINQASSALYAAFYTSGSDLFVKAGGQVSTTADVHRMIVDVVKLGAA
jgi:hypothetical protein